METFKPIGITHIAIRVNNMERSEKFYSGILGFEVERKMGKTMTVFRIGADSLVLTEAETSFETISRDYRVDHFGFNVASAEIVDQMAVWCKENDVSIVNGPGNRKNGRYLFITDPDGNMIEIFHEVL